MKIIFEMKVLGDKVEQICTPIDFCVKDSDWVKMSWTDRERVANQYFVQLLDGFKAGEFSDLNIYYNV